MNQRIIDLATELVNELKKAGYDVSYTSKDEKHHMPVALDIQSHHENDISVSNDLKGWAVRGNPIGDTIVWK
jgi:hypothetical protein